MDGSHRGPRELQGRRVSYRWPLGSAHVGVQLLPLGSLQKPEDVAEVGFLASEQARWITGQNMQADGGGDTGAPNRW